MNVREPESTYTEKSNVISLMDILGTRSFNVWSYDGSLTTPSEFVNQFFNEIEN